VKDKYLVAGVLVSAGASGALAGEEWKTREECEKAKIPCYIFPWSKVVPWALGIITYAAGHAVKNDSAKSFGAGSLIYAGASLVNYISTLATYYALGGGK
jgi:hypothetical protein